MSVVFMLQNVLSSASSSLTCSKTHPHRAYGYSQSIPAGPMSVAFMLQNMLSSAPSSLTCSKTHSHRAYGYSQSIPSRTDERGVHAAKNAVQRWNHSTAIEEPGTREAHLLEAVQEGVLFCICVCVLYLCGFACVCLL